MGLYCLESTERQQTFIPLYWTHLCSPNSTPMHLMSSLKAMTDFAIRTDLSALSSSVECDFTYPLFLSRLMELMVSQ